MFGAFGGLLGQSTEKKRQQQFIYHIKKEDKTDSEIEFISKYLESSIKSNSIESIKGILEKEEFDRVIKLFQFAEHKQGDEVPQESNQFLALNLVFLVNGSIELRQYIADQSEQIKKYEMGELIFLTEDTLSQLISQPKSEATYKLVCAEDTQIAFIQRSLLNKIVEVSLERFEKEFKTKINCLKAVFPNINQADQGQQRQKSKYFKPYSSSVQGTVITTTTSGSNDIFVVSKGKILVWVPKSKINQDYSEEFVIIGLLPENSVFNESYVLFNRECMYGTMMIGEGQNELFQINKENLGNVCENAAQDYQKANSEIKDRMYKNHIKRYSSQSAEELLKKQKDLCQKLGLNFDKIRGFFQKSTKDKKIVTHNLINKNEFNKNLENFNKIMQKSTFKTIEMKGDKEDIASTVTPRLVSRGTGLNQMTPAQQLSLIALRSSGKGLRDGTRNVNQKISDIDFDKVEQEKKSLNQLVIGGGGILVKKNIQHLDLTSKSEPVVEQPVEKKEIEVEVPKQVVVQETEESKETSKPLASLESPSQKKTLQSRLDASNSELLQKLGQFDTQKPQQPQPAVVDAQKQSIISSLTAPIISNKETAPKASGFIQMSEFSLKTTNKDKPFNSVFLKIAKEEITQTDKPKVEDKFAQQRKKLLNFGI